MKELLCNWLFLPPETPLWLVPIMGLVTTFFYFALTIMLRDWIIARGWEHNKLARSAFYLFGGRFLRQDIVANIVCFSVVTFHLPNRFNEGWTITAHANAILGRYYARRLKWYEKWWLIVALFICKHLGNIDDGHCSNYRRASK
jgi:hypothetical protein